MQATQVQAREDAAEIRLDPAKILGGVALEGQVAVGRKVPPPTQGPAAR
jgi:hypothetical protein